MDNSLCGNNFLLVHVRGLLRDWGNALVRLSGEGRRFFESWVLLEIDTCQSYDWLARLGR